jgi:hypothetical protein
MSEISAEVRRFYRIVMTNPPTVEDFKSNVERGKPLLSNDPRLRRLAEGISVSATFEQARNTAQTYPLLGSFIAELAIPEDAPFVTERTLRAPGHHTIWGEPEALLRRVVTIRPVAS